MECLFCFGKYRKWLIVSIIIVMTQGLDAQNLYFNISSGYAVSAFPSRVESFINSANDNLDKRIERPEFTMGSGWISTFDLQYYFTDNLGISLGVQYLKGAKSHFHEESVIIAVTQTNDRYLYGNSFRFIPQMVMKQDFEKIHLSLSMGPSWNLVHQKLDEFIKLDSSTAERYWDYSGPSAWGMHADMAISYDVTTAIAIQFKMGLSHHLYQPEKLDMTVYKVNKRNSLDDLQPYEKQIVFYEWIEDPFNQGPPDLTQPQELPKENFSYGNIYFQLGIQYAIK